VTWARGVQIGAGSADHAAVSISRRPGSDRRSAVYPGLAALLWTVRESLESVLYALVVTRLVVTDGSPRWLPRADGVLRDALEALRSVELLRAAEVDGIVRAARKNEPVSLDALMKTAPEPWPEIFADHRAALRQLVGEIDAAIAETKRVLQAAAHRPPRGGADLSGAAAGAEADANTVYRFALATLDTVPQLSLQEFLD
jgi:hypothetical protein